MVRVVYVDSYDNYGRQVKLRLRKPPPTDARPGSREKVEAMAERYAKRQLLYAPEDNTMPIADNMHGRRTLSMRQEQGPNLAIGRESG